MSDAENLEGLSNAEIRAKCLQLGLPNVPVTDSSRKLLIKKIRVSLGGTASPAAASPKKTTRRETINAAVAEKATANTNDNIESRGSPRPSTPGRGRRTISATTSSKESSPARGSVAGDAAGVRITERRRSVLEQVLNKAAGERKVEASIIEEDFVPLSQPSPAKAASSGTTTRIQLRHISESAENAIGNAATGASQIQRRREVIQEHSASGEEVEQVKPSQLKTIETAQRRIAPTKLPQPTANTAAERRPDLEKPYAAAAVSTKAQQQQQPEVRKNTLLHDSLIVLESDDEEEEELIVAAQQAEVRNVEPRRETPTLIQQQQPQQQRTSTLSYAIQQGTSIYPARRYDNEQHLKQPIYTAGYLGNYHQSTADIGTTATSAAATTAPRSSYLSAAAASSPYERPRTYTHEFSDEAEGEDDGEGAVISGANTPYLSSFARNLERLHAEPLGGTSRNRFTTGGGSASNYNFEPSSRRPLRRNNAGYLLRTLINLDRQYNLMPKIYVLIGVIVLILLYVLFS